eukprot:5282608-Prymnesium_polylepis.2
MSCPRRCWRPPARQTPPPQRRRRWRRAVPLPRASGRGLGSCAQTSTPLRDCPLGGPSMRPRATATPPRGSPPCGGVRCLTEEHGGWRQHVPE